MTNEVTKALRVDGVYRRVKNKARRVSLQPEDLFIQASTPHLLPEIFRLIFRFGKRVFFSDFTLSILVHELAVYE